VLLPKNLQHSRPTPGTPLLQEAGLLREVVEDRGPGDVRAFGDVAHGRRLVPLSGEELDRGRVRLSAHLLPLAFPAAVPAACASELAMTSEISRRPRLLTIRRAHH
jgi:hypothetical protein